MINIDTKCRLIQSASWIRDADNLLLNHCSGYYLIGCIGALELKKQLENQVFSSQRTNEILSISQKIELDCVLMEKSYKKETENGTSEVNQILWADKLIQ